MAGTSPSALKDKDWSTAAILSVKVKILRLSDGGAGKAWRRVTGKPVRQTRDAFPGRQFCNSVTFVFHAKLAAMTHDHPPLFPPIAHDHAHCVRDAIDAAASRCERESARFTPLRRRVLELVWGSHEPIGAYAILDTLKEEGHGAAPPTVYRALDFLIDLGLVHRLARLNAFVGCPYPETSHAAHFLICTRCGRAAELCGDTGIDQVVQSAAMALGFTVSRQTVEVEGLCPDCRASLEQEPPRPA